MNKLSLIATGLVATLFTLSAPLLHAQESVAPATQHRGWNSHQIKADLGLSDEQVAKIKTEFRAQKGPLKAQTQHVKAARADLRQAIQSGASESELRAAAAKLGSAEGDLAVVRTALFARIKPILTPEQLAKFQDLQARR